MTSANSAVFFLCSNLGSASENGTLKIPSAFARKYGDFIPQTIGLHLPIGRVWLARYVRETETVEGVDKLLQFFDVKPYHIFAFQYYGGSEFGVEIFNHYAVEIDYSSPLNCDKNSGFAGINLGSSSNMKSTLTEYEVDKLEASFSYNAYSTKSAVYEVVITSRLLEREPLTMVLTPDACMELGLHSNMQWIEIGFKKFVWHVHLKWEKGTVLFNEQWYKFVKAGKLVVGDICVFRKTSHDQKFDIAIFESENVKKFYKPGKALGKGLLKWFQVINSHSLSSGEVEVPRVFYEEFGTDLHDDVKLLLADGMEFVATFSRSNNRLFGMNDVLQKYGVAEKFVVFFEFVGRSSFYVSIYNDGGIEIFNELPQNQLLQTVLSKYASDVVVLSDSSEEKSYESIEQYNADREGEAMSVKVARDRQLLNAPHEGLNSFTIVLLRSHVDQNGHGVYLPKYMQPIYRKWKRGTIITLLLRSKPWQVAVLRHGKTFRFGIGWNLFTLKNKLRIGQKLHFSYVNDNTFEVVLKF